MARIRDHNHRNSNHLLIVVYSHDCFVASLRAASECKEDVTYAEVRIGARKQVHAGKAQSSTDCEEDVTYSQVKPGAKRKVKSRTVLECEKDVTDSEARNGPGEQMTVQKEINHGSVIYSTPVGSNVVIALVTGSCILLLVLVITLGVLYASNINNLQLEKAQFAQRKDNLTAQIDLESSKHQHCVKNLTGVSVLMANVQAQRDQLSSDLQYIKQNLTAVKVNLMQVQAQRDQLSSDLQYTKQNLTAVKDNLMQVQAQRDQLSSDLQYTKQNLTAVKDNLMQVQAKRCPSKWVVFSDTCYYFSNDKMTWEQSQYACIHDGGHLVIIESLQEQDFIRKKVGNPDSTNSYWIGMTDTRVEGVWVWMDNTTLNESIKFWDKNEGTSNSEWPEPNDWKPGEDCAQIGQRCFNKISCWFDFACDKKSKRICEQHATEGTTL
ncbi:hypothetical protein UPYG_G00237250 [Umbra pygmaea]|uniref:C-type lectin domain-containing protein n=1 Tax=Umbra pygmaea TaxID=75934 RepID=A0ABD0WEM1_UMBPY